MAEKGQCSDTSKSNYHPHGIPLVDNFIEIVEEGDSLAGNDNENVGKIKLYAWKGHDFIINTETDEAGVNWILAENWWPYQRPSFVTPPFAGYVSGHSTYSRAAAEVMTLITGTPYFPGGMGEFIAHKNKFLVFEEGPSVDVILQWATYRDASDQCSLSRIWGGIHPPADDIPGRIMGEVIGKEAFAFAKEYFKGDENSIEQRGVNPLTIYPNPVKRGDVLIVENLSNESAIYLYNLQGKKMSDHLIQRGGENGTAYVQTNSLPSGIYFLHADSFVTKIFIQ